MCIVISSPHLVLMSQSAMDRRGSVVSSTQDFDQNTEMLKICFCFCFCGWLLIFLFYGFLYFGLRGLCQQVSPVHLYKAAQALLSCIGTVGEERYSGPRGLMLFIGIIWLTFQKSLLLFSSVLHWVLHSFVPVCVCKCHTETVNVFVCLCFSPSRLYLPSRSSSVFLHLWHLGNDAAVSTWSIL